MARKTFLCLALLIGILLSASPVLPCEKTLFGPRDFQVGRFFFHSSFQTFKVDNPGDAILEISNANFHAKIRSGYVNLNGRFFSLDPMLHSKDSTLQLPVHLRRQNYLWVFLYGQRGASIKFEVKEAQQEQANHEPLANEQSVELDEDTSVSITLAGSDQDGDPLTFRIVSTPAHGTLSGDAPALKYTPSADYNGSDAFTFIVNDGQTDSKLATVKMTIKPVNDPPTAAASSPDQAFVGKTVVLDGSTSSDVDGDQLTYLWTLTSYPPGVAPALAGGTTASASFVPYVPGDYKAQLIVSDGTTDSPVAPVTVSVAYVPLSLTEDKLTASDGTAGNRFGSSVSVDGHRAIIGAGGSEAAYIFEFCSPWAEKTRLVSGKAGDGFGSGVAISSDYALVGAYSDDDLGVNSGSAYLFKRENDSWTLGAKLIAEDGRAGDFFGATVALSGDLAVVGAFGDDTGGDEWVSIFGETEYTPASTGLTWDKDMKKWKNSGGAYIFLKPARSWAYGLRPKAIRVSTFPAQIFLLQVKKLDKDENWGESWDYVSGEPVPLTGVADMGEIQAYSLTAPIEITNIEFLVPCTSGGPDAGSAYVFKRDGQTWTQQAHLIASDGAAGDAFGISVAISDETIIVGADRDDDNGQDSGSAYVFAQDGAAWVEEAKLLAKDGKKGDRFGASVAVGGNIAVVGAPHSDTTDASSGAAYVFRYNGLGWTEEAKLIAGDGKAGDLFGASVSISADYVVVGAPGEDGSGSVFVFKFDGFGWTLQGKVVPTDAADEQIFGGSVAISGDVILSGAMGDAEKGKQAGAAYAYSIDTYHTASISANPGIIKAGLSTKLSWSWVNALIVQIDPVMEPFAVEDKPTGSGSATVAPDITTTYTITAYGPYGKDTASVRLVVE
jgi:hypothetical protein